ncbi:MAG: serine protease [Dysgonamonadaceae bacterium]|jgi:membrane protein implicated in regulation of membrane protease activity|nr:serine protease [Dysgonamonadaceae bacterium]
MEWFSGLDPTLKIYWTIALVSSLIFLIQTVITFLGMDSSDGLNADFAGDTHIDGPFQLFSLRNLINFLLGYGWSAVCFYPVIASTFWLNVVAVLVGLLFVAFFFFLILQLTKLSKDNTFKLSDTVGKTADVYLVIPGDQKGKGKIQISINGSYHEIAAMTEGEKLPTGSKARVVRLIDDQTVMVSSVNG